MPHPVHAVAQKVINAGDKARDARASALLVQSDQGV